MAIVDDDTTSSCKINGHFSKENSIVFQGAILHYLCIFKGQFSIISAFSTQNKVGIYIAIRSTRGALRLHNQRRLPPLGQLTCDHLQSQSRPRESCCGGDCGGAAQPGLVRAGHDAGAAVERASLLQAPDGVHHERPVPVDLRDGAVGLHVLADHVLADVAVEALDGVARPDDTRAERAEDDVGAHEVLEQRQDLRVVNERVEAARHGREVGDVPRADPTLRLWRAVGVALSEALARLEQRGARLLALRRREHVLDHGAGQQNKQPIFSERAPACRELLGQKLSPAVIATSSSPPSEAVRAGE